MTVTHTRSGVRGVSLLHRLQAMADGVKKHTADPGFPNFFTTHDVMAELSLLSDTLTNAKAVEGRLRGLTVGQKERTAQMRDLYARGVAAVESYFGLDSATLREFALRPRKGPDSSHAKARRQALKQARKRKTRKEEAAAAAGTNAPTTRS